MPSNLNELSSTAQLLALREELTFSSLIRLMVSSSEKISTFTSAPPRMSFLRKKKVEIVEIKIYSLMFFHFYYGTHSWCVKSWMAPIAVSFFSKVMILKAR